MVFLYSAKRVCRATSVHFLPSRTFAGHNKWSKIKRKKAVNDAARNKLFTKILREVQFTLRGVDGDITKSKAVQVLNKAKNVGVPKNNIESAIKRATQKEGSDTFEMAEYEGTGPGGSLIIVSALTDNRRRTGPAIRHIFSKFGGSLGSSGAAAWAFDTNIGTLQLDGILVNDAESVEEEVLDIAMEHGNVIDAAFEQDGQEFGTLEILCDFVDTNTIAQALDEYVTGKGCTLTTGVTHQPKEENLISIEDEDIGKSFEEMLDMFEDDDDVQFVAHNVRIAVN